MYNLFPGVKMAMGPATEDGFYGDFDMPEGVVVSVDDLPKLEAEMKRIIDKRLPLTKKEISAKEARELFKGNEYKQEWIDAIEARGENISVYWTGDEFVDLCAGPHANYTNEIKAFKLLSVAGAYWHGDSKNKMLTRIYGTAFPSKQELADYLTMLEEAKKRDHRKLGKEMDLFHFEPEYAPGSVFWHDKGYFVYRSLVEYIRKRQQANGYIEVVTPAVMDRCLWETSGHWEKYGEHNYSGSTEDGKIFCIKPMSCPGGLLIYKQGIKSYKDLPLRMAEFGKVYRFEPSGSLMGLMRVREFTQDDAHIFCTPEQMEEECITTLKLVLEIYKDFNFNDVKIYLSTRPEKRIGSDEIWDICENSLKNALNTNGFKFEINEGEGAFYGPKLEFILKDAIGREWQCGTIQVDMNLPSRFDISYIGEDGEKHQPVMLHRALFGSIERFMGILIENYTGRFPVWLAPVQVKLLPVSEKTLGYAKDIMAKLVKEGVRCELDDKDEKIGYKIRTAQLEKVPFMLVLGEKEAEAGNISVRDRDGEQKNGIALSDLIANIKKQNETRSLKLWD
jgi:threonyl-tRNA synthetase